METEHAVVWHMNNPGTQQFKYVGQLTCDVDQCVQHTGFGLLVGLWKLWKRFTVMPSDQAVPDFTLKFSPVSCDGCFDGPHRLMDLNVGRSSCWVILASGDWCEIILLLSLYFPPFVWATFGVSHC